MERSTQKFHATVSISIFSALAAIIMFFEFPVLIWLPFLKVDLSDVITIIGTLIYGPVGGSLIALIKAIVHWLITGSGVAGIIGNGASVISAIAMLIPFNYFWKKDKKLLAVIVSALTMTVIMSVLNYFVIMPLYINVIGMKLNMNLATYVATGVIPFNIVKSLIISLGVLVIYPRLNGHFNKD